MSKIWLGILVVGAYLYALWTAIDVSLRGGFELLMGAATLHLLFRIWQDGSRP